MPVANAELPQASAEWQKLWAALNNPRWNLRTVDGLARETGLPPEQVQTLLGAHADSVRQAYVPDRKGRALYAPAQKTAGWREILATGQAFITKSLG